MNFYKGLKLSYIWLNRKVEYALIILKLLHTHRHSGLVWSTTKIVQETNLPPEIVPKVLQCLSRYSIVQSVKGMLGGYLIGKNFQTINFHYLNQCILGSRSVVPCLEKSRTCKNVPNCIIEQSMVMLDQKVQNFWSAFTVEDILSNRL